MRFSASFVALVAPLLVSAAPVRFYGKRTANDVLVFKFADVLEQLEAQFYSEAAAKFQESDFTAAGFSTAAVAVEQIKVMGFDEAEHSKALQAGLKAFGEEPITSCKFKFDSVLTDVATTAATARVVENVGVSAYLGGATLISDPALLNAAGSILSIEARHSSILNVLNGKSAIPSAFDIPLTPSEILAIASPFIDPSSPCDLGIPANPTLSIKNTGPAGPGTKLEFDSPALNGTVPQEQLFCQMLTGGAPFSIALPMSNCVVPDGINGPVAVFVTSDAQPLLNNVRDRAQDKLVAGPTVVFVDTVTETLGSLANAGAGGEVVSTQTISPAEASAVIASAGGAAAPANTDAPAAAFSGTQGSINLATGVNGDGSLEVMGWSNLPASEGGSAEGGAAAASGSASAAEPASSA